MPLIERVRGLFAGGADAEGAGRAGAAGSAGAAAGAGVEVSASGVAASGAATSAGSKGAAGKGGVAHGRRAADELGYRLRRKFILVAMGAVTVVLTLIVAGINVVNYVHVCKSADTRLDYIVTSGQFSSDDPGDAAGNPSPKDARNHDPGKHFEGMTPESPFDTRFFTVSFEGGQVADVNTARIAAIGAKRARAYAVELYSRGRTSGFISNYRYTVTAQDGVTTYVFVDCSRELSSFHSFLGASIGISCIGWLGVLVLVVVFSGAVIRPVVESYDKQKRFITDASHEIKTPLAVIDADVEVQEIENGETEWTKSIHEQVARLTALTERLVFLARMDEGAAGFSMSPVDLSACVRDAAEPFTSVAISRNKRLSMSIAEGVRARVDVAAVSQVVELLLDNATRYASDGSVIEIALRAVPRGQAELTVSNAVDELPAGDLDRLFDRFYRADASRNSATGGSGVGLSVVRAIAEAHGGTATVKGGDGQITFTVRL